MTKTKPQLEDRLIDFSIRIIEICEKLPSQYAAQHLGQQLLKSGTSPALNYGEAQRAESTKEFIQKMKVCLKELHESFIILKILNRKEYYPKELIKGCLKENNELIVFFVSSINTVNKRRLSPTV